MAGSDDSFGSASGSPLPAGLSDEEQHAALANDGDASDLSAHAEEERDPFADSEDDEARPRHTRPFRAWGAAHEEVAPSVWERFKAWLGRLFHRDSDDDLDE